MIDLYECCHHVGEERSRKEATSYHQSPSRVVKDGNVEGELRYLTFAL
jgi:hypothetical protein